MTYLELCRENRYLYGQLEKLTVLIGHAIVMDLKNQYKDYLKAKVNIQQRIDNNLEKLEDLWTERTKVNEYKLLKQDPEIRRMRLQYNYTFINHYR